MGAMKLHPLRRKTPVIAWHAFRLLVVLILLPHAAAAAPRITSIVNAATFGGAGPAAGSLATIFGTELATSTVTAQSSPLPDRLATTSVTVGGVRAPLLFVSQTQINFQVPWEACCPATGVAVTVAVGSAFSNVETIILEDTSPAAFIMNFLTGQGAVLIGNTNTVAAPIGSIPGVPARPALQGEILTLFCIGLGPVTNRPASGAPASSDRPSFVLDPVQVRLGGVIVPSIFAGLAPGFVGLYQVTFQVPFNAPVGAALPLSVTVANLPASFPVRIAVE